VPDLWPLGEVSPKQLQLGLHEVLRLCTQFGLQGKNVRYISSIFLPAEEPTVIPDERWLSRRATDGVETVRPGSVAA
jgi:hypothetical protein